MIIHYLATMLTTSIVGAFIMIGAKAPSMIQLKASRTDALKASQSVNALSRFRADTRLLAFVYIWKEIMRIHEDTRGSTRSAQKIIS